MSSVSQSNSVDAGVKVGAYRGSEGAQWPGRRSNHWGVLKVPAMSRVLSSIQHICFRKPLGSNIRAPNLFFCPGRHLTSARSWVQGVQAHSQKFWFFEIWAEYQRIWTKKFRHFFTIIWKLYFLVVECRNESLLCDRKHTDIFKINKLFLVTSCFVCDSRWITDSLECLGK